MNTEELVERLLLAPEREAQHALLTANLGSSNRDLADELKKTSDLSLRTNLDQALRAAETILLVYEHTCDPRHQALGLLARGNALSIGLGQYGEAIRCYDEAAKIYREQGMPVEEARSQIGKLNALGQLGEFEQAANIAQWAGNTLRDAGKFQQYADLTLNLGVMHARRGADREALVTLDQAAATYQELGDEGEMGWLWAQLNRAYVLRNLGHFEQAEQASTHAATRLDELGHGISAARARQMLALIKLTKGEFDRALQLLDDSRQVFYDDGRTRDAMLVELFITDCLLRLRRFEDVAQRCREIHRLFSDIKSERIVGLALLNEAVALAGLGNLVKAQACFDRAMEIFQTEQNESLLTLARLEHSLLMLRQGQYIEVQAGIPDCLEYCKEHGLVIEETQCYLIAAEASLLLEDLEQAQIFTEKALAASSRLDIPELLSQAHRLQARIHVSNEDYEQGLDGYLASIEMIERLRGSLMIEYRVHFLREREQVYQEGAQLCLEMEQPLKALELVERAKSRTLREMLSARINLGLEARAAQDEELVDNIKQLQAERDRLYRRWATDIESSEAAWSFSREDRSAMHRQMVAIEDQITRRWLRLLRHNQDYAAEASLWVDQSLDPRPFLDASTVAIEYFIAGDTMYAFLIDQEEIQAIKLTATLPDLLESSRYLRLNLHATPFTASKDFGRLIANCQGLLHQLYQALFEPLARWTASAQRIVFVPHGPLHYLPLHCLFDGGRYLIEKYCIHYLPSISLLLHIRPAVTHWINPLVVGHSFHGRLPHAAAEAEAVAAKLKSQALLEQQATKDAVVTQLGEADLIHLAAHGEFHPANPLFSGLALEDGSLTTLDFFNTRLQGAHVTLSGCSTGRSVVASGDELLGLMRALLYAGASSIVLSLWPVDDEATTTLMGSFYEHLSAGSDAAAAMQATQRAWIQQEERTHGARDVDLAHPYYWGAFYPVSTACQSA